MIYSIMNSTMWLTVLGIISLVEVIFTVLSLIAAATTKNVLKYLFWSKVHSGDGDTYWGLFAVYWDDVYTYNYGGVDRVYKYANSNCDSNACDNCGIAGQVVVAFSSITLLAALAAIVTFWLRSVATRNIFTLKIASIVCNVVTLVSSALSIIIWGGQCQASLYHSYNGATVTIGSAYGLVLGVVILCLFAIPLDILLTNSKSSSLEDPLNSETSPPAPSFSGGFTTTGISSSSTIGNSAIYSPVPEYCSFCGKKQLQPVRYCSRCGKQHILEEGLTHCAGCGAEI